MKMFFGKWLYILSILFLFPLRSSSAQYSFELIPALSVGEAFNDNIFLNPVDEESDYITTVSPGVRLNIRSEHNNLALRYAPTFVWYDEFDENNTVRHSGTLTLGQDLTQHLRFDLTDTYLRSEEPIEQTEEVEGVRDTRDTYWRNSGSASLRYLFGPENELTLGYRHSLLRNEDPDVDDGMNQNPFSNLTYWFNVKNGVEIDYQFIKAEFSRDDDSRAGDDYRGHAAGIRYIHRFTQHTRGSIGYDFTNRDFEGVTEGYRVHEGSAGFDHAFSPDLSFSVEGGVFTQETERSGDETGYSYNTTLSKRFEKGSFTLGGRGGWDEAYLEAERRGVTKYWGVETRLEYQLLEKLNSYAGGSFRQDRNPVNQEWYTLRGSGGLRWDFHRWFYLSLDHSYTERDDDINTADYRVNQLMLLLTGRRLFRW